VFTRVADAGDGVWFTHSLVWQIVLVMVWRRAVMAGQTDNIQMRKNGGQNGFGFY